MNGKYCVRCGRELGPDEPLINGLCPDCYVKYHGVFATTPVVKIIVCPRCGSWRYRGEWHDPLPVREITRKILLKEAYRLLNRDVELVDVDVLTDPYRINESQYAVKTRLQVLLAGTYPVEIEKEVVLGYERKVCPRCISIAGKAHRALVQIRSSRGYLVEEEKKVIEKILSQPGIAEDIVEVKENKHGVDVKLLSSATARRLSTVLTRETGAKVVESFKPTHYRPSKGSWDGITTLSVRLPDIDKGDLVELDGKPGVVREKDKHGFRVELLGTGREEYVKYEDYWKGRVKKPGYMVYDKDYTVIAADKTTLYLLHEETGEIKEYPRTPGLTNVKEGDRVRRIRIKDKVYMIKNND